VDVWFHKACFHYNFPCCLKPVHSNGGLLPRNRLHQLIPHLNTFNINHNQLIHRYASKTSVKVSLIKAIEDILNRKHYTKYDNCLINSHLARYHSSNFKPIFITLFKEACDWTLSWTRPARLDPSHSRFKINLTLKETGIEPSYELEILDSIFFIFFTAFIAILAPDKSPMHWAQKTVSQQWPQRETNHLHPSSVEFKNLEAIPILLSKRSRSGT
jgi:hypothetical protein